MHATHTPCPSPPCRSTDESYGVSAPRSTEYTPQRQIFWNLRKMHPLQPGRMLAVPPSTRLPIRRPASVGKRVPARLNWERLATVAQGIEQWFPKPRVGGSNPSRRISILPAKRGKIKHLGRVSEVVRRQCSRGRSLTVAILSRFSTFVDRSF